MAKKHRFKVGDVIWSFTWRRCDSSRGEYFVFNAKIKRLWDNSEKGILGYETNTVWLVRDDEAFATREAAENALRKELISHYRYYVSETKKDLADIQKQLEADEKYLSQLLDNTAEVAVVVNDKL